MSPARQFPRGQRARRARVARSRALERLSEQLDADAGWSNAELIRLMRREYFADVDALGPVQLPDYRP